VIRVGPYNFEYATYYPDEDILAARKHAGEGGFGEETPEGHAFLYPVAGGNEVVGVDVEYAGLLLEREGRLEITLPDGELVEIEGAAELVEPS